MEKKKKERKRKTNLFWIILVQAGITNTLHVFVFALLFLK